MTDPDFRDPNLDRAYRETPRDEPPPELDERIRAAARRAVGTRPQSLEQRAVEEQRRSWASRWRLPLSVAATVIIAATLTVMVQEEEHRPRDDAGRGASPIDVAPAREVESPAAPAASSPDAARDAPGDLRATPSVPDASPAQPSRPARLKSASEPTAPAPRSEPAPQLKLEERARELQRPAATDSAPAAPAELEMRRQAPAPASAPPLAAPIPVPVPPAAGALTAPAPQPANKTTQETAPASSVLRRDRNLGDRPERASREASAIRSPEAWVEYIRNLRAQGREAEATAELADLRRTYPDFQLPPDLAR